MLAAAQNTVAWNKRNHQHTHLFYSCILLSVGLLVLLLLLHMANNAQHRQRQGCVSQSVSNSTAGASSPPTFKHCINCASRAARPSRHGQPGSTWLLMKPNSLKLFAVCVLIRTPTTPTHFSHLCPPPPFSSSLPHPHHHHH